MDGEQPLGTYTVPMTEIKSPTTGWKTFQFAGNTAVSDSRGSAISSGYLLQPVLWAKTMIDAAREDMRFLEAVKEEKMQPGAKDYVIPIRKKYLADSSWETSAAEYAAGTDITATVINTNEGVQFTPVRYNYMVQITNDNIRTNALNMIEYSREEVQYKLENEVDSAISTALSASAAMSNTVHGMQTIFGGDATDTADEMVAGDIITTDMVADAAELLESDVGYYWNSNVWTASAIAKNAWQTTTSEPFILFIAPPQKKAFRKDPQFVSAAEYGSNAVVLRGEIGEYLGIKIICTTKCPKFTASDTIVYNATTLAMATNGHECFLVKSKKCAALVHGGEPEVKVFDYPIQDSVNIKLAMNYHADTLYADAIVRLVVSDA